MEIEFISVLWTMVGETELIDCFGCNTICILADTDHFLGPFETDYLASMFLQMIQSLTGKLTDGPLLKTHYFTIQLYLNSRNYHF